MNKKKVFKILGVILLVLIAIFLIHTIRNYIIISELQNNISKYTDTSNYYTKSTSIASDGTKMEMEYYTKDNKQVMIINRELKEAKSKVSMYDNGDRVNTYIESKDSKVAQLNREEILPIKIYNNLESENKWQTFLGSISTNIKKVNYNNKECYLIKDSSFPMSLTFKGAELYIERGTGLLIRTNEGGNITEKEYSFNNVDDSIFVEPDISQYTIKEAE